LVHGLGVDEPAILLVTLTPVPDGVKFTLPGPSVTLLYDAVTFKDGSMITLSNVTLLMCEASNPSRVAVGVFEPPVTTWIFENVNVRILWNIAAG
jgi:hypothetical protein